MFDRSLTGVGVVAVPGEVSVDEVGVLVERYRRYLLEERGLTALVVDGYARRWALPFLEACVGVDGRLHLEELGAADVLAFANTACSRTCAWSPLPLSARRQSSRESNSGGGVVAPLLRQAKQAPFAVEVVLSHLVQGAVGVSSNPASAGSSLRGKRGRPAARPQHGSASVPVAAPACWPLWVTCLDVGVAS